MGILLILEIFALFCSRYFGDNFGCPRVYW